MIARCRTLCYSRSVMTTAPGIGKQLGAEPAPSTLFLVPPTANRMDEGRRLAAPMIGSQSRERTLVLRGIHPDVIELTPDEDKERLGIERVREILRSLQYSPVQGLRKVCLLPVAEGLTIEAANALLKSLEEPPPHAVFVLLASHSGDLLSTIVSRSRVIRVPPRSAAETVNRLTAAGYSPEETQWLRALPLRADELDRLIDNPTDATAERDRAASAACELNTVDVLRLACSDDGPIARASGHAELLLRSAKGETDLLSVGVAFLAGQPRETLFLFAQELHAVAFRLARAAAIEDVALSSAERTILDRVPSNGLLAFCSRCDMSYRALLTYAPTEAIFLSLFTGLEGRTDEH